MINKTYIKQSMTTNNKMSNEKQYLAWLCKTTDYNGKRKDDV